jgi:hypothetical protein
MALSLFRCGLLSRLRPIGRCARARPCRHSTYIHSTYYYHMHVHVVSRPPARSSPSAARYCSPAAASEPAASAASRPRALASRRLRFVRALPASARAPRAVSGRAAPARPCSNRCRSPHWVAVVAEDSKAPPPSVMPIARRNCACAVRVPRRCLGCARCCLWSIRLRATKNLCKLQSKVMSNECSKNGACWAPASNLQSGKGGPRRMLFLR